MRRVLLALGLILGMAGFSFAQTYTSVTATITSPNGVAYSFGSYGVTLVNTSGQQATLGGNANFQQTFSGQALTTAGALSISLPSVTAMAPLGMQWKFSVCANPQQLVGIFPTPALPCFTYTSTGTLISGASVSLTSQMSAVAATIPTAAGASSPSSSIFYAASNCGGLANCVTWVDDDTTDNCNAATTAWLASINSYAGPGQSNVFLQGSGSGKAYKFTTCNLAFTGPAATGGRVGSVNIVSQATIDCAQSSANCIQMGSASCSAYYGTACHDVTWRGGSFTGCVSLTNACIEVEPFLFVNVIDDVNFINTGAGNATVGNCTNYSVQWDTTIGGMEFSRNSYYGTVKGQCFSNNNDTLGGQNTLTMTNNLISHASTPNCGSQAHFDSSAHTNISSNLIFGFSSNITLQNNGPSNGGDGGWMISNNNFDYSAGCGGVTNAEIQIAGTVRNVGPASIINNNVQSTPFIAKASGTTVQMTGWNIFGNTSYITGQLDIFGDGNANCVPFGTAPSYACYMGANPGFNQSEVALSKIYTGFVILQGNYGHFYSGVCPGAAACATNNVTSQNVNGIQTLVGGTDSVSCQVVLTQAATTSSTLPACVVTWTDLLTNTTQSQTLTSASITTNVLGNQSNGNTGNIGIKAGTNISVTTTGYTSVGATPMQYQVFTDITKVF
jgi:hypothetical protein